MHGKSAQQLCHHYYDHILILIQYQIRQKAKWQSHTGQMKDLFHS